MTKQMIGELQPGEPVDAVFLVAESSVRTTKSGSSYLALRLRDRTGEIEGRLWDVTDALAASVAPDDFVHVEGRAESYRNMVQLNVRKLTRAETEGLRLRDFLKSSERDAKEMLEEFREILAGVEDPDYRAVIDAFLGDEAFCKGFVSAPAAVTNHHAYLGGLLEHTLSMANLSLKMCEHYPELRRDLMLAGVLLHDAGKVRELATRRSFQYTAEGHLVGHVVLGVLMLEEKARAIGTLPEAKVNLLRHLILSHHGQLEYGAARLPMCAEAVALHFIDNLDAKLKEVAEALAADANADEEFTDWQRLFGGRLYKK